MKGIILATGSGAMLFPSHKALQKQILPVYDKPLIYYALYNLLMANVKEIRIIMTHDDSNMQQQFIELLGDGSSIGVQLTYKIHKPLRGIASIFPMEESFIAGDSVAVVLEDHLVFGEKMEILLNRIEKQVKGAIVFPGIYFYDHSVIEIVNHLSVLLSGKIEIEDINNFYLTRHELKRISIGKENKWFDIDNCTHLLEAANFVCQTQKATGYPIGCIEELAYKKGYISFEQLQSLAKPLLNTEYGLYIESIDQRQWEWES